MNKKNNNRRNHYRKEASRNSISFISVSMFMLINGSYDYGYQCWLVCFLL